MKLNFNDAIETNNKPLVLCILDGWGISSAMYAETNKVNAIVARQTRLISISIGRNKGISSCPKKSTAIRGIALITSI